MTDIGFVLIGIITLFTVFLTVRSVFSLRICALCAAVSSIWIILLGLYYLGESVDPVLIGILMGGSIVGGMYLLEEKLPAEYQMFKLPLFLTLVSAVYVILKNSITFFELAALFLLWVLLAGLYASRNKEHLKTLGKKVIECCKNW